MARVPVRTVKLLGAGREVVVRGLRSAPLRDAYHLLLTMPWPRFFALVLGGYLALNALFALGYASLGDAIDNARPGSFSDAFFFSVQTLATIGYGKMAPRTLGANVLVTLEALLGMVGLALTTGLVFARFARPTARVLFSEVAVVTPFDGVPSLMFRMANERGNQLAEARLRVTLVRRETSAEGRSLQRMHDLALLRGESAVFALTWTAIHPIAPGSPLHGATPESLRETGAGIVVSLVGLDDGLAQTIHARHTYRGENVVWNARLADVLSTDEQGRGVVDYTRFHDVVRDDARATVRIP